MDAGIDLAAFLVGVVVEAQQLALRLAVGHGVDVFQQGAVRRQEETVARVQRVQVGTIVQLLDGPVDDAHVLVDHRGVHHADERRGREDMVGQVDGTIAGQPHGVDVLLGDAHGVGSIVQHGLELAGHAAHKRRQHVGLEELGERGIGHVVPRAEALAQGSAGTVLPVFGQGLVAGHEHHGHVLLKGGLAGLVREDIVAVPTRVEGQLAIGLALLVVGQGELLASLRALGKVAQLEHRVDLGAAADVVGTRHLVAAIVEHGVAVQQVGIELRVGLLGNDVGHVGQRRHHLAHAVDESVQAADVLLHYLRTVHRGVAALAVRGVVVEEVIVVIRDLLVGHVTLNEVNHGRGRHVVHHHQVVTVAVELPVGGVGDVLLLQHRHGVVDGERRRTAHAVALDGALRAGECLHLVAVVDHAAEEQHLLLGGGETFVALHAPLVVTAKPVVGLVVGHEERLRTRLGQHVAVAKIVNQTHRVGELALLVEPAIDAGSPAFGDLLVEVVLCARRQCRSTSQQHASSGQRQALPRLSDLSFGFHYGCYVKLCFSGFCGAKVLINRV